MSSSSSEILRASAGSGKTTALVDKVFNKALEVLSLDEPCGMVVCTFTRKATQELKERLLEKACKEHNEALISYISSPLFITSTLHGIFSLFLEKYGNLLGFEMPFEILSSHQEERMCREILRDAILMQKSQILKYESFSSLLLACKKYSDFHLSHKEGISYFQKNEIRDAYKKFYQNKVEHLKSQEAGKVLCSFFENLARFPEKYNEQTLKDFLKTKEVKSELKNIKMTAKKLGVSETDIRSISPDPYIWEDAHLRYKELESIMKEFSKRLYERKKKESLLTYSDLETMTLQILEQKPGVAQDFSKKYRYWFIDEYQDTSLLQAKILEKIKKEVFEFCVGDPNQSIYFFRGARPEVFSEKIKASKSLPRLSHNYRSNRSLISFFNFTFQDILDESTQDVGREDTQAQQNVVTLGLFSKDKDDEVDSKYSDENEVILQHILKIQKTCDKKEKTCILAHTKSRGLEIAQFLRSQGIHALLNQSDSFPKRREVIDALSFLQFLANPHYAENLITLLRSPWCRIEDQELISLFESAKNSRKDPRHSHSRDLYSHWDVVKKHSHPIIEELKKLLQDVKKEGWGRVFEKGLIRFGFFDLASQLDSSGYHEFYLWKLVFELKKQEEMSGFNVFSFIEAMKKSESKDNDLISDQNLSLNAMTVQIMTIHGSKGLQFDHVLIPSLGGKISPETEPFVFDESEKKWSFKFFSPEKAKGQGTLLDKRILDKITESKKEEFKRLLYVAFTRARESLFISFDKKPDSNGVGRFLYDHFEKQELFEKEGIHIKEGFRYELITKVDSKPRVLNQTESLKKDFKVKRLGTHERTRHEEKEFFSPLSPLDLAKATQKGLKAHRLMEALCICSDFSLEDCSWISSNEKEEFEKARNYILSLEEVPMRELLKQGFSEWSFHMKTKEGVRKGRLDFWAPQGQIAWLVEYKSGNPSLKNKALEQLEGYSEFFKSHHKGRYEKINLVAIYPFSEEVYQKTIKI